MVVDHNPAWAAQAETLIADLWGCAGDVALRIEHIGSTAIPSMAAKDVLDLQMSVAGLGGAAAVLDEPLAALGFVRSPYEHDHVPAGSDDDPRRWEKRLWARRDHAAPDANLHLRHTGSPGERVALLFRDWFRAHPDAVPAYSAFKRTLASELPDVGVYSDVKDPVVDLILVVAEQWAAATEWEP